MTTYTFSFAIAEGIYGNVVPGPSPSPTPGYGYPLTAELKNGSNVTPWNTTPPQNNIFNQITKYTYNVYTPECVGANPIGTAVAIKNVQNLQGGSNPYYTFSFAVFLTNYAAIGAPSASQLTMCFPLTGEAGYYNGTVGGVAQYYNSPQTPPYNPYPVCIDITAYQDVPMEIPVQDVCIDPNTGIAVYGNLGTFEGSVAGGFSTGVYQNATGTVTKVLNITGNPIYTVTLTTAN
jgi:hypothetical protein